VGKKKGLKKKTIFRLSTKFGFISWYAWKVIAKSTPKCIIVRGMKEEETELHRLSNNLSGM
jgi:hypothetical protein